MVTRLILIALCCTGTLCAQERFYREPGLEGMLQGTASLYPAWMLNRDVQNNYVAGHLNYFFHAKYSFRGEFMTYIDAQGDTKYISSHTQLQAAFGRHFPIKRWSPYVYYSMGLAAVRLHSQTATDWQPAIGLIAGTQFHASRIFYFFAECNYQHMQDPSRTGNLDQLYVSAGLGFQLRVKR